MRGFADTAYVHAKIYGLRSRLLSRSDYTAVLKLGAFERFFPSLPALKDPVHATMLKEHIFCCSIGPVITLASAYLPYEELFTAFLRFFEARNVKLLLGRALQRQPADEQWYDIGAYGSFTRSDLDAVASWDDFQGLVKNTYLSQLGADRQRPRFEEIGAKLDLQSMEALFAAAGKLACCGDAVVRESLLMGLALVRACWSRRLEQHYGWGRKQAQKQIAALGGSRLQRDDCVEPRIRLFAQRLRNMPADISDADEAEINTTYFEQKAERCLWVYAAGLFGRDMQSSSCVAGYLWLLYYQIRNLFLIGEGIRFSLPADSLLDMLICEA